MTSAGQRNATPLGVAFLAFGRPTNMLFPGMGTPVPAKVTCQLWQFTVVSEMPIKRLMRATQDG